MNDKRGVFALRGRDDCLPPWTTASTSSRLSPTTSKMRGRDRPRNCSRDGGLFQAFIRVTTRKAKQSPARHASFVSDLAADPRAGLILEIDIGELLAVVITMKRASNFSD
jgi:hypothetical protein